jgi:lipopolysaccharide export system protein LptA
MARKPLRRRELCAAALATLLAGLNPTAPAAADPPPVRMAGRFYTIETTAAHYNAGSGAFSTQAPVHISRPGLDAFADRAEGNARGGVAVMRGNVRVHDAGGRSSPQGAGAAPATLTCDELDVDAKTDVYRAVGHARYETATRSAAADTMILDRKHHTLHLAGAATISDGDTTVRADVVDADMARHDTVATGSPVVITRPVATPTPPEGTSSPPGSVGTMASPPP